MNAQHQKLVKNINIPKTSKIICKKLELGEDVIIGENVILAGDKIVIGDNVKIGEGTDIRSREIKIGEGSDIANNVKILVADTFEVGLASRLSVNTRITCRKFTAQKFLYVGNDFNVGYGGTYESTSIVELGNRVALGPHTILNANHKITMEDDVGSGSYASIWTHGYHFGHSVLDGYPLAHEGVHIEKNVWLGYHVTVLPSARIGENSIIAACSVVSKSIPKNCLAAGAPAVAKRELHKTPLDINDSYSTLKLFLEKWSTELDWKGIKVELSIEPFNLKIEFYDQTIIIQIIDNYHQPDFNNDYCEYIFIAPSDPYQYETLKENNKRVTLFNIRNREIHGVRNEITEDLRDFLRRHTLSCGDDKVFSSIEPNGFQYLRSLTKNSD